MSLEKNHKFTESFIFTENCIVQWLSVVLSHFLIIPIYQQTISTQQIQWKSNVNHSLNFNQKLRPGTSPCRILYRQQRIIEPPGERCRTRLKLHIDDGTPSINVKRLKKWLHLIWLTPFPVRFL